MKEQRFTDIEVGDKALCVEQLYDQMICHPKKPRDVVVAPVCGQVARACFLPWEKRSSGDQPADKGVGRSRLAELFLSNGSLCRGCAEAAQLETSSMQNHPSKLQIISRTPGIRFHVVVAA